MTMKFIYSRKIHFADTDSAGVVYFAQLLSICHEGYEEYLASLEIDLKHFFRNEDFAIPIVHAEIDFFKPLFCGDVIDITLNMVKPTPKLLEINYEIFKQEEKIAVAKTKHICINPQTRKTQPLPEYFIKN